MIEQEIARAQSYARAHWRSHPEVDDLAQECAVVVLERPVRRALRYVMADAARRVLGRYDGSPQRVIGTAAALVTDPVAMPVWSSRRARLKLDDEDYESKEQWREWCALSLAERQSRILEAHRALGSSCPDTLGG